MACWKIDDFCLKLFQIYRQIVCVINQNVLYICFYSLLTTKCIADSVNSSLRCITFYLLAVVICIVEAAWFFLHIESHSKQVLQNRVLEQEKHQIITNMIFYNCWEWLLYQISILVLDMGENFQKLFGHLLQLKYNGRLVFKHLFELMTLI